MEAIRDLMVPLYTILGVKKFSCVAADLCRVHMLVCCRIIIAACMQDFSVDSVDAELHWRYLRLLCSQYLQDYWPFLRWIVLGDQRVACICTADTFSSRQLVCQHAFLNLCTVLVHLLLPECIWSSDSVNYNASSICQFTATASFRNVFCLIIRGGLARQTCRVLLNRQTIAINSGVRWPDNPPRHMPHRKFGPSDIYPPPIARVGATQWRHGRAGAVGTGLRERAEWTEPGSVTDSYWPCCVAVAGRREVDVGMSRSRHWNSGRVMCCTYM